LETTEELGHGGFDGWGWWKMWGGAVGG